MSPQRITLPAASARTKTLAEACIRKMTSVSQKPAPRALLPAPGRRKRWTNLTPAATSGLSTAEGAPSHRVPTTPPPGRSGLAINQSVMRSRCFTSSTRPRWTCFAGLSRKPIVRDFHQRCGYWRCRFAQGVQAWFPLQLTAMPGWLPFDPANARETGAILHHALHALYLEGTRKMVYLATNADNGPSLQGNRLSQNRRSRNVSMSPPRQTRRCRFVCAAPADAFARVQQAAKVLKNWGDCV